MRSLRGMHNISPPLQFHADRAAARFLLLLLLMPPVGRGMLFDNSLVILRLQEVEFLLDPLDGLHNVELEAAGAAAAPGAAAAAPAVAAGSLQKNKEKVL